MDPLIEAMKAFAQHEMWTDVKEAWLANRVRGRWRGMKASVEITTPTARRGQTQAWPGQAYVKIKVGGRPFTIRPRGRGSLWTRPITLFGPRLVEPEEIPAAKEFYVTARDVDAMRRVFADAEAVAVLRQSQATVESLEGWLKVERGIDYVDPTKVPPDQVDAAWNAMAIGTLRAIWKIATSVAIPLSR